MSSLSRMIFAAGSHAITITISYRKHHYFDDIPFADCHGELARLLFAAGFDYSGALIGRAGGRRLALR